MIGAEQEENMAVGANGETLVEGQNGTNGLNGTPPTSESEVTPSAGTDPFSPETAVSSEASATLPPLAHIAKAELKRKTEEYLKARWEDQFEYYSSKASANKKIYQRIRLMVALIGFLIPVTVTLPNLIPSVIPAVLGVAVSFLTAWETIYRYGDNWRSFRQASEELKRERVYFESGSGSYARQNPQEAFIRFVENCEAIMAQESGSFFKRDAQTQQGSDQGGAMG